MKRKKLVVISHTEHYKDSDGIIKGWGSTVRELDFLADYWENVTHVACLYNQSPPDSTLPYIKSNVHFVGIPPYGGKSMGQKLLILTKIPKILFVVLQSVKGASEVQLRLPTSMGLFLLPLFSFFLPRKFTFWIKYAGNWKQQSPPFSYKLQRWWLRNNFAKCKVTINGFWEKQPKNCYSFENPSLTLEDVKNGLLISNTKTFNESFVFVFIGRLDDSKGVTRIIEALNVIPSDKIKKMHFVGDGINLKEYQLKSSFLKDKIFFHGFLNKIEVHNLLAESHFLLLPSSSEGFPKVIAEAACYGAIPVVSDVGSISHYINDENGFVWKINSKEKFSNILQKAVNESSEKLKKKSKSLSELPELFTFDYYYKKLNKLILGNNNS